MSVQYATVTSVGIDIILYWPLEVCLYKMMHMFFKICYSFTGACQYKQITLYDFGYDCT